MSSKQHRKARGIVYIHSDKIDLWKKCEDVVKQTWLEKLLIRILPKRKERYLDIVGATYRHNLKRWAKMVYNSFHDRDLAAFEAARRKMAKRKG